MLYKMKTSETAQHTYKHTQGFLPLVLMTKVGGEGRQRERETGKKLTSHLDVWGRTSRRVGIDRFIVAARLLLARRRLLLLTAKLVSERKERQKRERERRDEREREIYSTQPTPAGLIDHALIDSTKLFSTSSSQSNLRNMK